MATGITPNIPGWKAYAGSSASSVKDASGAVFYANSGWFNGKFATYVFRISPTGIQNIPLNPQPEARGTLEANEYGLALTSVIDGKFVRYEIDEYVTPAEAGAAPPPPVQSGGQADAELASALNALSGRVNQDEVVINALGVKNATQDKRLSALEQQDAKFAAQLAAIAQSHGGMSLDDLRTYLWNDRFIIDLIYDIIANRKDVGIRKAIRSMIIEELDAHDPGPVAAA